MYTAQDARREVRECIEEGYGFDFIRIFLNDLKRGGDLTGDEWSEIYSELIRGEFGIHCAYGTMGGMRK